MIDTVKPYSAYKDSKLAWLGQIPQHWKLQRAKWLFRKMDRPVRAADEVVTCFRDGLVTLRKNRRVRGFTESLKEIGYQGILRGDLVIHAMDAFAGAVGVADSNGKGSPVYSVCEPRRGANAKYYSFVIREMARSRWILALAKGIRERSTDFRFDDFASLKVPLPPPEEQSAIVSFSEHLDRLTRRYVAAQKQLIAVLNERKQVIIHGAVTRGVCGSVPLKSSGVEWLEEVPDHWDEGTRLKYISSLKGRLGWQGLKATEYTTAGPYIVSSAHFRNERVGWDLCPHVTQERYEMDKAIQLRVGDILLMKDGAAMGKLAYVDFLPDEACLNSHLLLLRPLEKLGQETYDPQFMFYFMTTRIFQDYVQVNGTGATFSGVSQESVGNYRICIPPIIEQREIVRYLQFETRSVDRAIAAAAHQMDLVREYRTRLVADVVTGKLDVREVAARLPRGTLEPEPTFEEDSRSEVDEPELDSAVEEVEA